MSDEQPSLFDQPPRFGTEPRKLARREGPDTSREAAQAVDSTKLEGEVFEAIRSFGPAGCISDDVRALTQFADKAYSSVTARYRALIDKGFIVDTGERRVGNSGRKMRVMLAKEFDEQ